MRLDTLLVHYRDGFREVSDFGLTTEGGDVLATNALSTIDQAFLMPEGSVDRAEGFVSYPEDTANEADEKALATISQLSSPRWMTRVGIEPTFVGDTPLTDWDVGDTITVPDQDGSPAALQAVGLMITEDEAGHVAYAPQVGDVIRSPQERQAVINRSMSAGTINGRDPQAMPASASAAASTPTRPASVDLPPWSLPGAVYVSESGRYYSQPTTIRSIRASLDTAGTSTTTVTVYVNGVSADTISLTSGTTTTTKAVSITVPALGYLKVGVTTAGTGAEDLTVQLT